MKIKSAYQIKRCFGLFFLSFLLLTPVISTAQSDNQTDYMRRFENASRLYDLSRWYEAGMEFRRAQEIAGNINDWSQALYWVILSELAYSDYGSALKDMDELQRTSPGSSFTRDMMYHRARVYYNQGFFDEALLLFRYFTDAVTDANRETSDRRAAAFFWMGECLYSMGQFDDAENFYSWVINSYPESPKVNAASYRLDLIRQKKIEMELLALLQWSHEESLRTSEDYQRKIRTYEYTLNAYQRRISELAQEPAPAAAQDTRPTQTSVTPPSSSTQPPTPSGQPPTPSGQPSAPSVSQPRQPVEPPVNNIPPANNPRRQPVDDSLLEWARRMGVDLQGILEEIDSKGTM